MKIGLRKTVCADAMIGAQGISPPIDTERPSYDQIRVLAGEGYLHGIYKERRDEIAKGSV